MKKKVLSVILAAVCTMGLMAGCGAGGSKGSTQSGAKGDSYTVGISQFAEHGSLDNCREGFLEGLKEEGIEEGKNLKVDYQNAQTDTGTASTIADSFVSEKVDMICAIATPCAASAYNSAMNADIPTVYTAVSDPVAAGLAKEDGSSVGNITGSSDVLPVEEQLKMIREMMPDAKKIGILYTTSEANSCSTIEEYKELADKYQIPDIEKAVLSCTGTTMKRTREIMLEIYGEDFPYDIYAKESSAIYHSRYDGGRLPMKPGVVELLTFLKEDGKKIALASSTRRQTVTNQLKDAGILNFFDNVICGDMVEHSKPAPDIFLKACAELGVAPERAYAIEDSYNGIRAAHAGHLLPIMVPDLLPANEEMQEKAEVVLPDLFEVIAYLKGEGAC